MVDSDANNVDLSYVKINPRYSSKTVRPEHGSMEIIAFESREIV